MEETSLRALMQLGELLLRHLEDCRLGWERRERAMGTLAQLMTLRRRDGAPLDALEKLQGHRILSSTIE
jgi:hypothetical protein